MRILFISMIVVSALSISSYAHADDGFGNYFANEQPSAFGDSSAPFDTLAAAEPVDSASDLADIQPAAGAEMPSADAQDLPQLEVIIEPLGQDDSLMAVQKEIEKALSADLAE